MRHLSLLIPVLLCSSTAFAQYKAEPAGAPPSDLPPAIAKMLLADGTKVTNGGKPVLEIWFRTDKPSGPKTSEDAVTLPNMPQGALLAVIRFDGRASDRRGQAIKPANGDHQGAAPQRDFLLMVPASDDKDPSATPAFDALVDMSKKASNTNHPAVMSLWKADDTKIGRAS